MMTDTTLEDEIVRDATVHAGGMVTSGAITAALTTILVFRRSMLQPEVLIDTFGFGAGVVFAFIAISSFGMVALASPIVFVISTLALLATLERLRIIRNHD